MLTGNPKLEAQWIGDEPSIARNGTTAAFADDDDYQPPRLSPLVAVMFCCLLIAARIRTAWQDFMRGDELEG